MSAEYTIQQYLLDRANIQDTVSKITLYYDTENASALADECYAPGEVTIDYTSMFGGKPLVVSNQEWAASAIGTMRPFDAKQHVLAGLVIEQLPQPAATATVPDHCEVITNVNGHIMRKAAATSESAAGGVGNMVHNGGRYEFELVRIKELEEAGENPWRVRRHKCILTWSDGNNRVMEPLKDAPIVTRE
ncbi:hypothetical protein PG999_011700 [Apiospora kogelbergensis]|uniref:SnoaL-like domain-containing protein n=1 Tax=Apiospora kogelbergensis TaxID=1337665 RepID=A0AAW0QG51_9PEZI